MFRRRENIDSKGASLKVASSLLFSFLLIMPLLLTFTTYESPTSAGTVYLQAVSPVSPSGVQKYFNVTISNSQSIPTAAGYDQKIVVDSNKYSSYEAQNLMNVIWFDQSGQIIPSWIQSGDTSNSKSTVYWLNMIHPVNADSSLNIYLGFESKNQNLFSKSGNEGVAPTLTPTYAEYDNGKSVFPFYSNFAGTSVSSQWNVSFTGNTSKMVVNNGITFATSKDYGHSQLISLNPIPSSYIVEANVTNVQIFSGSPSFYVDGLSNFQYGAIVGAGGEHVFLPSYFLHLTNLSSPNPYLTWDDGGWWVPFAGTSHVTGILGVSWPTTGVEYTYYNGNNLVEGSDMSLTSSSAHYIWLGVSAGSKGNITSHIQWVRARSGLPDNVMPSVQVGGNGQGPTSQNSLLSLFYGIQGLTIISLLAVVVILSSIIVLMNKAAKKMDGNNDTKSNIDFIDRSKRKENK